MTKSRLRRLLILNALGVIAWVLSWAYSKYQLEIIPWLFVVNVFLWIAISWKLIVEIIKKTDHHSYEPT